MGAEGLVLGRGQDVERVSASGVSKRHAKVVPAGHGFRIVDLGSRNGVVVNGARVGEHDLAPGDLVRLGDAELQYVGDELPANAPAQAPPPPVDDAPASQAVIAAARRLLGADLDLARLLALVMDVLLAETRAARGFVVLSTPARLSFFAARNMEGHDLESPGLQLSRTVIDHVARTGETVVVSDARQDLRFQRGDSVQALGLRSVLAVPLRGRSGAVEGAVYLDDPRQRDRFGAEQVGVAEAIAGLVAGPLENAREHSRRLRELERVREALQDRVRFGKLVARSTDGHGRLGRPPPARRSDPGARPAPRRDRNGQGAPRAGSP